MVFFFLSVDQVVRVIVIQKTLIEHAEKLRQVKAVLEEQRTFWNGAGMKFLRDIQKGSTEAAELYVEALMILKFSGVLTHAGRKQ
ncbi:hypothetical protein IGI04_026014, partial [Brassica rapa subsp. trilocularis]